MKPVTDPSILMQLNGGQQSGPRPVTDPRILMQLNGASEETANLLGDPRSAWETSGASQLPAIREQVMSGKPLARAVASQPPVQSMTRAKQPKQLSDQDYLTGLVGQAAQGLTLGFADEGIAALYAGLGVNDYQENLRRIRGLDKQFVAENPVTSFAANVVGGIPVGGPLVKAGTGLLGAVAPNAARAVGAGTATAGQRVASGLATGAVAGAGAGAGTAEGGLAETAAGAATGGLLGAGLGGAIPAVTSAMSGAGSAALRAMPFLRDINLAGYRPFTSADDRATQLIGQAMARGGDQGAAEAAMTGAVRSQVTNPAMASVSDTVLGDVSPELRSLTGAVLRSPGAGAAKAREFIATRQEGIPLANVPGQGSRLAEEVSAVGGEINLRDTVNKIIEDRDAAAKPLFDKVRQVGNIDSEFLRFAIQDRGVKLAMAKAVQDAKRAGDIPADFKLDFDKPFPSAVWMKVKEKLGDQVSEAIRKGNPSDARSTGIFTDRIVNEIDDLTGGAYRPALDAYAGPSALRDAAEEGRKAIASNVGPDDIQRMVSGFQTQGERDLFSQAYKSSLSNMMASASRTTNAANKALLSDQQVAKIRAAFPADQADEIIRRASVRDAQFKTYAETKGSQTQARQMAERDIEDGIQSGMNAAGAIANPKGYMIGRAMEWLSNVPARSMSERVRNALASQLVNPDPKKVASALKAVEGAAKREAARIKTVTGNRQFLSRNAAATQQLGTLGPGVSGAANMVGDAWQGGDTLDRAAMLSSPIPIAGDIAGVANDARNFASGKTPMTAANLGMAALGALPFVPGIAGAVGRTAAKAPEPEGITAYHGSPNQFDKFDMSKMGSGEGDQFFGKGLYFADQERFAKDYKGPNYKVTVDGKPFVNAQVDDVAKRQVATDLLRRSRPELIERYKRDLQDYQSEMLNTNLTPAQRDEYRREYRATQAKLNAAMSEDIATAPATGAMYQVKIKADQRSLPDFFDTVSQHPKAARAIANAMMKAKAGKFAPSDSIGEAYQKLETAIGPDDARKLMLKNGINGFTAVEETARAGMSGKQYVVFDDKLIDILKRYGIPLTVGVGGAVTVLGQDMPDELKAQMGGA